jgi:ATP-binding cassette subfamily C protein RsaD
MLAMGMWGGLQRRWQTRRDDLIAWQAVASDRAGLIMATIKFSRQVVQTLILGGGAFLAIRGSISPGAMIAASLLVGRALAPIELAVGHWKGFVSARGAWERLQIMFRSVPPSTERMTLPPPKGLLSVESMAVMPPGARAPTLQGVSFAVQPGVTLGVIGPSAAGKSSLVRGLVGVWPIIAGAVRLDGYDLRHWDPEQLGRYVGYLPQDVELFAGMVSENIARFTDFDSLEVIEAARIAGVHEMIQALPNGYETQIGEGGTTLSGGQRQRLALARAIFRRPPLIVLDEPNANLDVQGEQALAEALTFLKPHCAIVIVTHKTNILALTDKILVVQNGVATHFGDRDAVLGPTIAPAPPAPAETH